MALSTVERYTGQQQETFSENDTSLGYWSEPMPTIEDLRQHLNSCLSCGVNWQDDHVSLDCAECGGYSMSRPCPACDGKCGQQWKRDMAASHTLAKAKWTGNCALLSKPKQTDLLSYRFYQMRSIS